MNIHIKFVKEWLVDPKSHSQKELDDNADSAEDAASHAYLASRDYLDFRASRAFRAYRDYLASLASRDASHAYLASRAAATGNVQGALKWVEEYEGLTK